MIEVKNLTKQYGNFTAIRDVSFRIENGHVYGLLGPNGAGKSTTMNIITGCLAATSGTVRINGFDIFENPTEAKACVGYLPELPPLYPDMTPQEYLSFVAEAKGVAYDKIPRQVKEAMELTRINGVGKRLISALSKGYRQRVGIAQALLGSPEIIILDEPTVGLDPQQIIEIRELVRTLGKTRTVIISSHILSEINELCDHVIILSKGTVVADDSIETLEKSMNRVSTLRLTVKGDEDGILEVVASVPKILSCSSMTGKRTGTYAITLTVEPADDGDVRGALSLALAQKAYAILSMDSVESSLESVFLSLTGEESKGSRKKAPNANGKDGNGTI